MFTVSSAFAATIQVSTPVDEAAADNGNCTLREAILAATTNLAVDLCPPGSAIAPDTVQLDGETYAWSVASLTIGTGGPLILRGEDPSVNRSTVVIAPPAAARFLRLSNGADVALEHLDLTGGSAEADPSYRWGGALLCEFLTEGSLTLRDVTLADNRARAGGAVLFATGSDCSACSLVIEDVRFEDNVAEVPELGAAFAGGLYLSLQGETTATIVDTRFTGNEARSSFGGNAVAGAFWFAAYDDSTLEMRRGVIDSNSAISTSPTAIVGGAQVLAVTSVPVVMEDIEFRGNDVVGPSPLEATSAFTFASGASVGGFILDRLRFDFNDWSEDAVDFRLSNNSPSPGSVRNVALAYGSRGGAFVRNVGSGSLALSHWTVTGHIDEELRLARGPGAGELRLDSSILWSPGSATELVIEEGVPTIDPDSNLIGLDPLFVGPLPGGSYELSALSPAIDLGEPAPSASPYDLKHAPRTSGDAPDAGAYERDAVFGDGFESEDAGTWSAQAP